MTSSKTLDTAVANALKDTPPVISDLQSRKDATKQRDAVQTLNEFLVLLKTYQAKSPVSSSDINALSACAKNKVLPTLETLIAGNADLIKMGQLNKKRIMTPTTAEAQNKVLQKLQGDAQDIVAFSNVTETQEDNPKGLTPPAPPKNPDSNDKSKVGFDSLTSETIPVGPYDPYALPGETQITVNTPDSK